MGETNGGTCPTCQRHLPYGKVGKRTFITEEQWEAFFEHYQDYANIRFAAQAAGINRWSIYDRQRRDPEFAERLELARQDASDRLLQAAWIRAVEGTPRHYVNRKGEQRTVMEYSDKLLIELLHANMPERFNKKRDIAVQIDKRVQIVLKPEERQLLEPIKRRLLLGGDPNFVDAEFESSAPDPEFAPTRELRDQHDGI